MIFDKCANVYQCIWATATWVLHYSYNDMKYVHMVQWLSSLLKSIIFTLCIVFSSAWMCCYRAREQRLSPWSQIWVSARQQWSSSQSTASLWKSKYMEIITKSAEYHLKNIGKIVAKKDFEKLICAFIFSRLKYLNGVFTGCCQSPDQHQENGSYYSSFEIIACVCKSIYLKFC